MTFRFEKERLTALSPDGFPMGHITFPRIRAGLVSISSISILPGFRNQGAEDAMMEALLAHLDQQNLKAVLIAPAAQQYVEKNPRWKKILPGEIHFTKY